MTDIMAIIVTLVMSFHSFFVSRYGTGELHGHHEVTPASNFYNPGHW